MHHQLDERVAGARGRRRAEDGDGDVGQSGIDLAPAAIGVRDDLAVDLDLGGEGREEDGLRQVEVGTAAGMGQGDAVVAEQDLGDAVDAVGPAIVPFGARHGPRSAGDVGKAGADPATEDLHPAAGSRRLDDRGPVAGESGELLGDRLAVGKDRRGADDPDLVARLGRRWPGAEHADDRDERGGEQAGLHRQSFQARRLRTLAARLTHTTFR